MRDMGQVCRMGVNKDDSVQVTESEDGEQPFKEKRRIREVVRLCEWPVRSGGRLGDGVDSCRDERAKETWLDS